MPRKSISHFDIVQTWHLIANVLFSPLLQVDFHPVHGLCHPRLLIEHDLATDSYQQDYWISISS